MWKLLGRIETETLSELGRLLATEGAAAKLVLDLSEVRLAGEEAVKFLASCEENGTKLLNCPAYIRDWITRQRNGANQDEPQ